MKKIAFYVEGQTEQFFIKELLIAIAGKKNIQVELERFAGKVKPKIQLVNLSASPVSPKYFALIYDCGGDESVKARILEDYSGLFANGYSQIIGLRDLFPLTDLARLEHNINTVRPLPVNAKIVIAVNEVEAWFISETNHFLRIDPALNNLAIVSTVGFDPTTDDMTLLPNPALNLDEIYQIVGKRYNKKKSNVERTVQCIDYSNLYINVSVKITKLNNLVSIIDGFLT